VLFGRSLKNLGPSQKISSPPLVSQAGYGPGKTVCWSGFFDE